MAKIAYFAGVEGGLSSLSLALKKIAECYESTIEVSVSTSRDFKDALGIDAFCQYAMSADLALFHLSGGKDCCPGFDQIMERLSDKVGIYIQEESPEYRPVAQKFSVVAPDVGRTISEYIRYGGEENISYLLLFLANHFDGSAFTIKKPMKPPWEGIYHPDMEGIPSLDLYLKAKCISGRLTVGLWFYHSMWTNKNLLHIDALIREIEHQGANALTVFLRTSKDTDLGSRGAEWVVENYFMRDGQPIIDVLISPLMSSISTAIQASEAVAVENIKALEKLGVPVIQGIVSTSTLENWQNSLQGLNSMDVSISVAMPEFDGALIAVPIAAKKYYEADPVTGIPVTRYQPIAERIEKLVRLAINWGRLRHIPNVEKRIAIIFHNYPPRNDRIGNAFGLDSPASVWNILHDLDAEGYKLDRLPDDGRALIEEVRNGVTNDRRWSSSAEMARKAIATISSEQYKEWFEELPASVQARMTDAWGEPPGDLFVHDNRLIIPGIMNGNIFIGIQPPRGFLENPAAIYHSPDHPIPHHYYAYYRWIRNSFKADLVMHIGKHGSLEWLPGKSVGLSDSCFPDIAISDLPNIYPYIINNPGEGTQAKRRSYCCIIDHLVPVMHNADAYEGMAELEVQLNEYSQAKTLDQGRLPHLKKLIWVKVCEANLNHDLEVAEEAAFSDFDKFLERLHDYIHEMADTQIRDGLHIFGEPPEGKRLDEFLVSLTRLSNGSVPSLRESLAELMGHEYDELLHTRGRDGGHIIEEIHALSLSLVERFHEENFDADIIVALEDEVLGKRSEKVEKILDYIGGFLAPSIAATTKELSSTLCASKGGFIPPGPSGAPTRGMASILPTGRNFYSLDPRAVPSPSAWRVGVALGDDLLNRYLLEKGEYPQNIGIVIWGGHTMRTMGESVAEALYLMGVRPIWEEQSGRVEGIEMMPLVELRRPRIDITFRISGFFRDAFPNVVELLDEAVALASSLSETAEENFLAGHVRRDIDQKVSSGIDPVKARIEACYRVFGCRPGAYGAGVSHAIDAKNWKDENDLAEVYLKWGGYAYGRENYGITVPDDFRRRLSQLDVTVKNEDTREYDMLDGDDFYSYHGGMISAVKAFKGELPCSYSGDSSDPERVKNRSTVEETKHIFRARILNPKWIESMQRHGYKGAGDISRMVDIAFGWDATAEVLEDWMYEELANKYALDEKMQEWLKDVNPHALLNISERLLEAIDRDMWNATDEMKEKLREVYLEIEGMIEDDGTT